MTALMEQIEAAKASGDREQIIETLNAITTTVMATQFLEENWEAGVFTDMSLGELAQISPRYIPVVDRILAAEGIETITALVENT